MIKYKLICNNCDNSFDSWFSSSKEYEKLKKLKHINCFQCNSFNVEKTLMSPNVVKSKKIKSLYKKNLKALKFKKKIREYQTYIKNNFEYVGENFAFEARSIHYKSKKKNKGIYGNATSKEVRELKEEGIETDIIPWIKDNDN
tara:strand:- start:3404 stop:3832 length:429 start_codon:yes stop_codon:yes gene_type:complete